MNEVIGIINSVGFPIFTTLCLGFYVYDQNKKSMEKIDKIQNSIIEDNKLLRETINNNTLALNKLCEKLDM